MTGSTWRRVRVTVVLPALLAVVAPGCRAARQDVDPAAAPATLAAGDHEFTLVHDQRERFYIVRVPPAVEEGKLLPLVLSFHGGGGNARQHKDESRVDPIADREGFLLVHPYGTGGLPRKLLTWNAGTCCGYAADHDIDDVGFTRAVVAHLAARAPVDRRRIYATGHSNGAMMTYRLAVEAGDLIAAAAPVAGAMVLPDFAPTRPVPILHIHSVDDPRALYEGGLGPPYPVTRRRVDHQPVEGTLQKWIEFNGCAGEPVVAEPIQGRGRSRRHTATRIEWPAGKAGAPVIHWKLTGAGHGWPGTDRTGRERLIGPATTVIDAGEESWRFFRRFALPGDE